MSARQVWKALARKNIVLGEQMFGILLSLNQFSVVY